MGNAIRLYLGTRERLEGGVISLCGAGGVCEAINENWLAAWINFNPEAPLAGFITPCVAVRDRSGLIPARAR